MLYQELAELYNRLESTTKRLEKTEILSKFLKKLSDEDKDVMYLLVGKIYPEYSEKEIGISNQTAIKAISKSTGVTDSKVLEMWKKIGDLGEVAKKLIQEKKQRTLTSHVLTVKKVIENLRKLPELEGKGTVDKKISLITELLTSAEPLEALYLVRTLIGDLRIGTQESTIRESLAKAFFENDEDAPEKIQEAIDKSNDTAEVFDYCRKRDIKELEKISMQIGKPIKAMLAQKVSTIKEGFEALGKPCALEYKYDVFRLIIHKKNSEIKLFTRSLENVTKQFPEVVEYIKQFVKGNSVILDSEAVGYDKKTKRYTSFQHISQRIRRKYHIEKLQDELPVEINVFDVLYYNGKSIIDKPFEERAKLVRQIITNHPYKIISSKQIITSDEKKAKEFYKAALKNNQEGIIMKNLKAPYKPGRRVGYMLKIKSEDKDLDLVITGAEYGKGKRSGWFSSFIVSCKGKNKGEYLEVGKVGTGIVEKEESKKDNKKVSFQELTDKIKPIIEKEDGKRVWIKPKIIVAVTYQEIQRSPNYNSGWALRFPRVTALRTDKPLLEIADLNEIEKDFKNKKRNWKFG
ncbi:MAG: ATP-dependent DNA ligase [Nanoarchaeota archaeon]|nr:ATP-dependent DNA ligase [Nanoarchaeota archaeon]